VLNGHSHGYERTKPMNAWRVDETGCGIMHVTLGGGCADDLTFGYVDVEEEERLVYNKPKLCVGDNYDMICPFNFCKEPSNFWIPAYQPPMLADGKYQAAPECALPNAEFPDPLCPPGGSQPDWSAYRRASYGVGQLELLSPTKARWTWFRLDSNRSGPRSRTDSVVLTRDPVLSCGF
jgi:hypothetical protein